MRASIPVSEWSDVVRLVSERQELWRRDVREADEKSYESVTFDAIRTLLATREESPTE